MQQDLFNSSLSGGTSKFLVSLLRSTSLQTEYYGHAQPLSMPTKMRLNKSLVISVLLYSSETWSLTKADERRLEAFHMNCQRRILGIRWFYFVTNASVTSQTGEEDMASRIRRRRLSFSGHVRRLPKATPAHSALRLAVDTRAGYRTDNISEWKRRRGRPCRAWMQQIEEDSGHHHHHHHHLRLLIS